MVDNLDPSSPLVWAIIITLWALAILDYTYRKNR